MSKKVVLLGDLGTDHSGFPPTPVIAGSPNVLIGGKPVARVGDSLAPHSKPKHPPYPRAIAAGSATVPINGMPATVTGSAISCRHREHWSSLNQHCSSAGGQTIRGRSLLCKNLAQLILNKCCDQVIQVP
ncbi:hypothetical protein DYI41_04995 [Marinobacter salarius]|uniref:PAAR domain-containing protein n=1 Tax=Marinobacter salarius TaxID=1420917 RepID=UPI001BCE2093|nr:PAAR domain-containing protein [Marinobacter salarius]MBS8230281.1 hypothetical protein [Marinobacter salarius]